MQGMWKRLAERRLDVLRRQFPAVLILGARQVGKTTLARQAFPAARYCDLQEPRTHDLFAEDPTFQIERQAERVLILDEAQTVPQVFAALRGMIDRDRRRNGRFVLLGSAHPSLARRAAESLAGRVGILDLDPLLSCEVARGARPVRWERLWLGGGFPDAVRGDFREWWEAYLRTYVERDLSQLGIAADPVLLRRMLTMLSHLHGGLLNLSTLGQALGVSHHTVRRYVDTLEGTFLVRRLPPFFRNIGKRLTKSPKVYLRDTGLLHHLLNISTEEDLESHPSLGASWEGFVIEEIIRREKLRSAHTQFFFWRTAAGAEADLVLERGSERVVIEVKASGGASPAEARRLASVVSDVGASLGIIVTRGKASGPLVPGIEQKGFGSDLDWIPGAAA